MKSPMGTIDCLNPFGNQVSFDPGGKRWRITSGSAASGLNPFGNQVSFDRSAGSVHMDISASSRLNPFGNQVSFDQAAGLGGDNRSRGHLSIPSEIRSVSIAVSIFHRKSNAWIAISANLHRKKQSTPFTPPSHPTFDDTNCCNCRKITNHGNLFGEPSTKTNQFKQLHNKREMAARFAEPASQYM